MMQKGRNESEGRGELRAVWLKSGEVNVLSARQGRSLQLARCAKSHARVGFIAARHEFQRTQLSSQQLQLPRGRFFSLSLLHPTRNTNTRFSHCESRGEKKEDKNKDKGRGSKLCKMGKQL